MLTSNLGYPRIGLKRELKTALETYWQGKSNIDTLLSISQGIQVNNWQLQKEIGIDILPCGDFSLYDSVLDTAFMLNVIPPRFPTNLLQDEFDLYFAMARGYQDDKISLPPMEMTKWFNTNYHYLVPEVSTETKFSLKNHYTLDSYLFAKSRGFYTRPVILGPVSFLLLSRSDAPGFHPIEKISELLPVYQQLFEELNNAGVEWIQLDEPFLAADLSVAAMNSFLIMFELFRKPSFRPKVILTAYFDDISINKQLVAASPFEGLHLDMTQIKDPKILFPSVPSLEALSLGVIDGRNVWRCDLQQQAGIISKISKDFDDAEIQLSPSCSLLFIPQDLDMESGMDNEIKPWLSFAKQKLQELVFLKNFINGNDYDQAFLNQTESVLLSRKNEVEKPIISPGNSTHLETQLRIDRLSPFFKRIKKQDFSLPKFPTTTIGSFPQTAQVRKIRSKFNRGEITQAQYDTFIRDEIKKAIHVQEDLDLDVLVHGEFERNDMVQYFSEKLAGFTFTKHGWVQSFGSRCVRPPIIYGPVSRLKPMTIGWSTYAQSLTKRPVKGMLTGPVTILQWSFVRDDQPRSETCREIALAIREEVLDLEAEGIRIIQIDEPALREGLPVQRSKWPHYLSWAVECFKYTAGGVKDETQIHTHMCYAEFNDIIEAIGAMDADVISIEASRSKMQLLDAFADYEYPNDIGPGVYDIHTPVIPKVEEIVRLLKKALEVIPEDRLWVNPDCGLKTRTWEEVIPSLTAIVSAAKELRTDIK